MASKCYPIQSIRLQVTRKTASSISSIELQHCYAIFCLRAYHVKWLYRVSDPPALQQSSKLRNNTKVRVLQQWEKEKTGHSSLPQTTQGLINMVKLWVRLAADNGKCKPRTKPCSPSQKGTPFGLLCKGRLTILASYSGSNGYSLALSKFLFNNSSNFLDNTTISRYNGYYIYLHRPCTAGI